MFQEYDLHTNGLRLNVATGPAQGVPLLLLHGVARRWQDFMPIAPTLAARWQVVLVDHRGHGKSDRAATYRVVDYVDDALGVLATLHQPALIYGHSLGALTAIAMAALRPELVQAIVLEDPPSAAFLARLAGTSYHATFRAMRELAGPQGVAAAAHAFAETLVPTPHGPTPLALLRDAVSLRFVARCLQDLDGTVLTPPIDGTWLDGYDEAALWAQVQCPVLLLRGDPACGGMLPADDADRMTATFADCTRIDVQGVGHLLHWMATETTLRHTVGFLESL